MRTTHKILTMLGALMCCCQVAQAYEYFNIYFHDGTKSDAFYAIDVDSIKYSKYDLDNVEHNDWKVQEIWTTHGVYRYLLADIDSLSFTEGLKHELPTEKKSLKVLAIGNSFVDDPMAYFGTIVNLSGIDRSNLCFYSAVRSGSSLENWATSCKNGEIISIDRRAGQITMPLTKAPLKELLAQEWDVVTVQQVSTLAQDSSSLSPCLPYLVNQIRELCPNKDVVIAFQQVWSYWRENDNLQSSIENWQRINEVAKLTYNYGIDMIIPTGTAIQNARATELNTAHGLTRDGQHLVYGVGRYVAACTWFEALIAPVYGVSVVGNTTTVPITNEMQQIIDEQNYYDGVEVNDLNRTLCQQCAVSAINNPFQITVIE